MSELETYKQLVNKHPIRERIKSVGPFVRKGNTVAVSVGFRKRDYGIWEKELLVDSKDRLSDFLITGIAVLNPEDTFDLETGKVVALYHALQQAKGIIGV